MKNKNKKLHPWNAIFRKKREVKRIKLKTDVTVEQTLVGGIWNIHVIDPEVVEPISRPSFFISEKLVQFKSKWKWN